MDPFLYNINLYFQGEPMMHPDFFSFLDHSGISTTTVSTNGHFLTEENSEKLISSGLKKLIVSLDGMDQKVYSEYRRKGDFNKVVAGIKNVLAAKTRFRSSLKLEIQFLVNRYNLPTHKEHLFQQIFPIQQSILDKFHSDLLSRNLHQNRNMKENHF